MKRRSDSMSTKLTLPRKSSASPIARFRCPCGLSIEPAAKTFRR